jgi:hypothetical protein
VTLSGISLIRSRIQDNPLLADRTYNGDGTASAFLLPHRNITSGSAFVPITTPTTGWSATAATFDPSGQVQFSGVISANSAFRLTYVYSVFSDDEIGAFTAAGGGVVGASIEALQTLMFDAAKRSRWGAPNGESFDDTQAMQHLREMYHLLKQEQYEAGIANGDIASWGLNQGDW